MTNQPLTFAVNTTNGTLLDEFDYIVTGPFDHTTPALQNGNIYKITISGRAGYSPLDGQNNSTPDAAYCFVNWQNLDLVHIPSDFTVTDWDGVNGRRPFPDLYSTNHTYDYYVMGTGTGLAFSFRDNPYADNIGGFHVIVANLGSYVVSGGTPPTITTQPADFFASAFNPATFSVIATGTDLLAYQWQFNGTNLLKATDSTLTITNAKQRNVGQYTVVITNAYGSVTSSIANLFLYPYLNRPFTGVDTYWGQTNTLSVGAWGSGNLSYQWYFNGVAIGGATSSTLPLGAIQFTNAGQYSVVMSSSLGSVTNAAYEVVVNPANVSLALCPNVVIQGTVGYNYAIYSTTNLGDTNSWMVETNIMLTQPIQFWDDTSVDTSKSGSSHKFYRVEAGQ